MEWNKLRKAINNFLAKEKINEDKQLGPYFISRSIVVPKDSEEIDRDRFINTFKNKVIMYLFEDAAKQKRPRLFNSFIEMFDYGILQDAGKVSAEIAKLHAETEFEKYRVIQDRLFMSDFDKYMLELEENAKK